MKATPPSVGVLVRFSNSAATLPGVLAALKQQTLQPDVILGVNSGSQDHSPALIHAAGGQVIHWQARYEHSKVLNFGLRHLNTDLVLIISSHTVLESPDTLARMVAAMTHERTACVSLKWDADSYYSDRIDWNELRTQGLKFGSIYSNSMGMIRRTCWEQTPFDESLPTAEDYAWSVEQLKQGHVCKRLSLPFNYRRSGSSRDGEFARITFGLARKHGLKVVWLGVKQSLFHLVRGLLESREEVGPIKSHLRAWVRSRMLLF